MVDLGALARILWAGRRLILLITLVTALAGAGYVSLLATPMFQASAVVMLESRKTSVAGLDSVLGDISTANITTVKTEMEVLRGRTLMGRVVDELNLTEDPEFNAALRAPGVIDRLKAWVSAPAPDLSEDQRRIAARAGTISALLGHVEIRNMPGSLVFEIVGTSASAHRAAELADTVARLYIDDQLRVRFEATETAAIWLSNQLATLRAGLEEAETAVLQFRTGTNLIDATTLAAMERQLKETRNRSEQIRLQAGELAAQIARIEAAEGDAEKAAAAGNTRLAELAGTAEFAAQLAIVLARLSQDQVRQDSQARALESAAQMLAADIARQSQDLITLDQLTREAESSRLLYEHFQTRLKETSAQIGMQQADSRILSEAVQPSAPASPRKKLILALAGVAGLMIGMLIVLLRDLQSRSIRSIRELEALTGRIVLGKIPEIPGKTRKARLDWLASHPTSPPAEAVRNLRTSVLLAPVERAPQVIAVTSSLSGEGKTTLTAALAQNLAAMGQKVLIIEGDIRNSEISRLLAAGPPPCSVGLVEVIRGEIPLAQAVQATPGKGDLLAANEAPLNAVDLFSSEGFGRLIAEARASHDIIVIDTPPVLAVPDARLIARHADATVFVVRWNRTHREEITEALQQLDMVNIRIAGSVLSHVSPEGMRHYGYGYGYGYGRRRNG